MATTGVIEHCDVVEDIAACSLLGEIVFAADALTFEQLEKLFATALSWELTTSAHAGLQFVVLE